jgi:quercetin dioxygenase-like cupin family protein
MQRSTRRWAELLATASLVAGVSVALTIWIGEVAADPPAHTTKIVRIYTGPDNQSHFEDIELPLKSDGKVGFLSDKMKATGVVFRYTSGDYNYDFHTAPRRQYVVNLEGEVEIEVGDGTKRILRSGDILLAEDTTGQGHISRAVAGKPRRSLFITLD